MSRPAPRISPLSSGAAAHPAPAGRNAPLGTGRPTAPDLFPPTPPRLGGCLGAYADRRPDLGRPSRAVAARPPAAPAREDAA